MYVILGATGKTGSIVANSLLDKKKKVRVVGRDNKKLAAFTSRGAEAFTANITDEKALTRAFTGAEAVYAMIPPDLANDNYRGFQSLASNAIAKALENAGVRHAVTLSSFGADKPEKTGPIAGLHEMESKLNLVKGLNVLHLRAGYFMENTLPQAGVIRNLGRMAGPVDADVALPMIATKDIGAAAAEALGLARAKGYEAQAASLGSGPTAAVAIANAVSEGKLNVMPEVLVTGGGSAFEGLAASLMRGMNGRSPSTPAAALESRRQGRKKEPGSAH